MPRNPQRVQPIDVEQIRPLAEGLARRLARQPADVDDLVQVGLLAVLVDYPRWKATCDGSDTSRRYKPLRTQAAAWSLARQVLYRAMIGYYGAHAERAASQAASLNDERVGAVLARFATSDSYQRQSDLLELHDYLDALEQACGHTARLIAQNLIEPFGECAERLMDEVRNKQAERLRQRRARVRRPRIRFSQRAVREAMALDKRTFAATMEQVRGFTREWLTKTA